MTTPLTITPTHNSRVRVQDLLRLVQVRRDELMESLLSHGALLFRGFQVENASEFGEIVRALAASKIHEYAGGASPRQTLSEASGPIYNSTDYPEELELPLHNELSYSDSYPDYIYFGCLIAPDVGGATTLGDSRRILASIPHEIRSTFEAKGVQYIRLLGPEKGSGYSWQDAFRCDERSEVERQCARTGAEWAWLENGLLKITQRRPALTCHPATGKEVWFNQAAGFHPRGLDPVSYRELLDMFGDESRFRLNVRFGDGSAIEPDTIDQLTAVLRAEAVPHVWQSGDILMLDNILTAHGRAPFRGRRSIAVAMS